MNTRKAGLTFVLSALAGTVVNCGAPQAPAVESPALAAPGDPFGPSGRFAGCAHERVKGTLVVKCSLDAYCKDHSCPSTWDAALAVEPPEPSSRRKVFKSCRGDNIVMFLTVDTSSAWYFDERTQRLVGRVDGAGIVAEYGSIVEAEGCKPEEAQP